MAKPPTTQAVRAKLRRAGYEQAAVTGRGRRTEVITAGYHATKYPGAVAVTWWPESVPPAAHSYPVIEAERAERERMLAEYTKVILEGGWTVEARDVLGDLLVTAGKVER